MSDTDRGLASALARHEEAEREQALRALLMRPLMTSADPDFPLSAGTPIPCASGLRASAAGYCG